ncbi:protoporphyrinogen oxidase [Kwoniella dejecticola CBS 10117]|uniref:Protoporphyrinogen oxidase n=1 Tax=Kwoniella dejecticola CBS 10117 TaxID=1296121 RepID=A0A1A5ZZP9_9TREE|nr:protoporphyrinogen oxidase [Kwoniella dejecticola CBS 10117]OBR83273.1 protoporphyrinogen oxidase [Kwoniella dejecticola CBS 10117]
MSSSFPRRITILGGGLSGLTTAYRLSQLPQASSSHTRITLIEGWNRLGGWIDSQKHHVEFTNERGELVRGDVTLESGPRSLRPRGSRGAVGMLRLLKDLDLTDHIIPIPFSHSAARNRFLLDTTTSTFHPQLTALPSSLPSLLTSSRRSNLLKGLIPSILSEPFKPKISSSITDESVDSFFSRRFSPSIAQNLASSMVHGIYATSSSDLSVRAAFPILWEKEQRYNSVLLGMFRSTPKTPEEVKEWEELGELGEESKKWSLYGLQGGLGALTTRLYESIKRRGVVDIRSNEMINSIYLPKNTVSNDNAKTIHIHTSKESFETDHIISSISPSKLHSLLQSSSRNPAEAQAQALPHLKANPYTSVGVVNLVYPIASSKLHPEGFGYLIPRPSEGNTASNPHGVLGVIFDSTAVPLSEDLKGVTKITIMMGGPYWSSYKPTLQIPNTSEELISNSINHLETVFPILKEKGIKPILKMGRVNYDCIPTYTPGHGGRMRELHHAIKEGEWGGRLSLVGNGYGGVGLNDCVYSVDNVIAALRNGDILTGLERWESWE